MRRLGDLVGVGFGAGAGIFAGSSYGFSLVGSLIACVVSAGATVLWFAVTG